MGYTTTFKGELKFTTDLTSKALGKLKSFLGEDCREHPEWGNTRLTYIDLELLDDFSGVKWDGSEKTYDLEEKVNLVIENMRKEYPDFGFQGKLSAQGEDVDDRWFLAMVGDEATKETIPLSDDEIVCPHCSELIKLSEVKTKKRRK
jgi:hypothetical protein